MHRFPGNRTFWNINFEGPGTRNAVLGKLRAFSSVVRGQKFYDMDYTTAITPGMCVRLSQSGSLMAVCGQHHPRDVRPA
jgi:hypothetical protein